MSGGTGYSTVLYSVGSCAPYREELDNNWFYPASAPALSFHQVCTCFCLISCEPIVAATVLSTLSHAPESSPDWSWEHYCQEEEEDVKPLTLSRKWALGIGTQQVNLFVLRVWIVFKNDIEYRYLNSDCWRHTRDAENTVENVSLDVENVGWDYSDTKSIMFCVLNI